MFHSYAHSSHNIHCGDSKLDEITWTDLLDKPVIIVIYTILFILIFVGFAFALSRATFDKIWDRDNKITSTILIMVATVFSFFLSSLITVFIYGLMYL